MEPNRGFVLKTFSYSESDLISHILTRDQGVLHCFVRGGKNSKKRFGGGVLQPPHFIGFSVQPHRSQQDYDGEKLVSLKEASLIRDFEGIRKDYGRIKILFAMIQVILVNKDPSQELFNHFGSSLKALEQVQDPGLLLTHFVVRFLNLEGVLPQNDELEEMRSLPMAKHGELSQTSSEGRLARLAEHYLCDYLGPKGKQVWPK